MDNSTKALALLDQLIEDGALEARPGDETRVAADLADIKKLLSDNTGDEPDLVWDHTSVDHSGGDLSTLASHVADSLNPGNETVIRVTCAQKLSDRWLRVTLSDDNEEQQVNWAWGDPPATQKEPSS